MTTSEETLNIMAMPTDGSFVVVTATLSQKANSRRNVELKIYSEAFMGTPDQSGEKMTLWGIASRVQKTVVLMLLAVLAHKADSKFHPPRPFVLFFSRTCRQCVRIFQCL